MSVPPGRAWKIALAGLGRAAREIHLPAYAAIPGLTIVGGCDPIASGGQLPFPVFSEIEALLDRTRPDLLAVLAPPSEHFALTCLGLRAGCHVLCEKPFMPTLQEAEQVCELARQRQRSVVVNNQYRFMRIHAEARRRIGTPGFGELLFVDARQTFRTSLESDSSWRGSDQRHTCQEFGTHVLDLCRFLFNAEPSTITARMPRPGEGRGRDYLNLIRLDFPGDRSAQITLDRLSRGPHRYLTIQLDGTEGCIETRIGGSAELRLGLRGGTRRPFAEWDVAAGGRARLFHGETFRTIASEPLNVFAGATRRLVEAFLTALESGSTPPCDAEDNRKTLALMLAAYASDESGTSLTMGPGI